MEKRDQKRSGHWKNKKKKSGPKSSKGSHCKQKFLEVSSVTKGKRGGEGGVQKKKKEINKQVIILISFPGRGTAERGSLTEKKKIAPLVRVGKVRGGKEKRKSSGVVFL